MVPTKHACNLCESVAVLWDIINEQRGEAMSMKNFRIWCIAHVHDIALKQYLSVVYSRICGTRGVMSGLHLTVKQSDVFKKTSKSSVWNAQSCQTLTLRRVVSPHLKRFHDVTNYAQSLTPWQTGSLTSRSCYKWKLARNEHRKLVESTKYLKVLQKTSESTLMWL